MDNLFLLEDDTYALVDYESENRTKNRIKYVNYIARVVERLYREEGPKHSDDCGLYRGC